jgi:hypothetical protein
VKQSSRQSNLVIRQSKALTRAAKQALSFVCDVGRAAFHARQNNNTTGNESLIPFPVIVSAFDV